jgi:ABC-2 type transport system permease protein
MMTAFFYHLNYDFRTGLRDRSLLLMNYLFPLFFYVMMGLLMTGINPTFSETLIPAMIVVGVMAGALLGLPNPIVAAREAGIYRSFKINGVPALSIVSIPVLSSLLHMIVIATIITLTAGRFFNARMPENWGSFIVIGLLFTFAIAGIGMLIGVISTNGRTTILISQLIFLPSMMLSGLMLPTSLLPPSLYRLALLLPPTYAMNAWRGLSMGLPAPFSPYWSMVILLVGGLIAFGMAVYLFDWDSNNRSRRHNPLLALLALFPYVVGMIFLA